MIFRLVIATPVDGSSVTGPVCANGYATALALLLRDNFEHVKLLPASITYSCDIARARNRLAAMVLREMPEATHVLWWDSDVVPHDPSVVVRMLITGHDLIAAPYLRKMSPPAWSHRILDGRAKPTREDAERHWMEVRCVAMGFTLTSTALLRTMSEASPAYIDKRTDGSRDVVRGIFDLMYLTDHEGDVVQESEDNSFCYRSPVRPAIYLEHGGVYPAVSHVGLHAFGPGVK